MINKEKFGVPKSRSFWLSFGLIAVLALVITLVVSGRNSGPSLLTGTIDLIEPNNSLEYGKMIIQIRESNNGGQLIAEQIIDNPEQTNSPFEISYNPDQLKKDSAYVVLVKVYDTDNQLLSTGNTPLAIDNLAESVNVIIKQSTNETPSELAREPEGTPTKEPEMTVTTPPDTRQQAEAQTQSETNQAQTPVMVVEVTATATVNIHYDPEYNLPQDAKLTVHLLNLSQPSTTIASKEILNPNGSPIAVELTYDTSDSSPDNTYTILAGIYRQDGKQLMTNSTFGFEMKIDQIDGVDVHLITIYPDEEKSPEQLDASVSGSIHYGNNCQLPPGTKLTIQIRDVSLQDTPSPLIVEQEIVDPGGSPVKFELKYDSNDIKARNLYSISGRINDPDGKLLLINDTSYEVITNGNPVRVDLPLVATQNCR